MAVLMVRERGITTAVKKRAKVNVSLLFFLTIIRAKTVKYLGYLIQWHEYWPVLIIKCYEKKMKM